MPTSCTIIRSADADLDRTTCNVMMSRAHFQPARDGDGHAVAGAYTGGVNWILPPADDGAPPLAPMRIANAVRLDERVNVTCSVSMNGGPFGVRGAEEECGFLSGSGAAQALRAAARPAELILVYSLVPEGEAAIGGNEAAGATLISEATAQLAIGPEGGVAECRPAAVRSFPPQMALRIPPACWMQGQPSFVAPVAGPQTRRAATSIRVYYRRSRSH